jgi:acyl-CoA synthetase (AMP-forming)/AMP-acid ligase II
MFDFKNKLVKGRHIPQIFHPNVSIGQILLYFLEKSPEKIAQICHDDDAALTCDELRLLSIRVCLNLAENGVESGDVVGLVAKNSTFITPIIIGCFLLKCPIVTLDPDIVLHEVDHVLKHVKPKLIFCDFNVVDKMKTILSDFNCDAGIVSLRVDRDDCLVMSDILAKHVDEEYFM